MTITFLPVGKMSNVDERLCLQWNDFGDSVSSAFKDLREDKEFTDVTLACEDGKQVEAHKVILIASSPFFLDLLKGNKHPHPLIYMRGVQSENLIALLDFFYLGQANVFQENFDSFLALAEDLQLKGMKSNQTEKKIDVNPSQTVLSEKLSKVKEGPNTQSLIKKDFSDETGIVEPRIAVAPTQQTTKNTDIESLDRDVKAMMTFSENEYICKMCGKRGSSSQMRDHIETNHMTGISVPCELCGKAYKSRHGLASHKSQYHRKS